MLVEKYRKNEIIERINKMGVYPLDILLVGATGVGKSSTINALFGKEITKVGYGVYPETMDIEEYSTSNKKLRFWDSPGLGDTIENDKAHKKKLFDVLYRTYTIDNKCWGLIDLVVVILDCSSRNLGTTYSLLTDVICKVMDNNRIIILLNQCDMEMKGRNWDTFDKKPNDKLIARLQEKSISIRKRLYTDTGVKLNMPVYYSAVENYNLDEVMNALIKSIPYEKRSLTK